MPAGAPGSSSRGRGGKFKKYTRGGGKHFSRDLQPVDSEGNQISMWSKDALKKQNGNEESSEEESSEEDSEEDSDDAGPSQDDGAATRDARKQQKKARKEAAIAKAKAKTVEVGDMPSSDEDSEEDDDDMPANPNHSKAARKQAAKPVEDEVDDLAEGVGKIQAGNRKEREALEAAAAKERYMKLQAQGKTDDAKADLARLKLIREQREAEAARRQAEKEEREEQEKARRAEIEAREAKKREAAAGPKKGKKKN
ncbi:hypothetical protein NLU13_8423 [Sarocladium strictum]|uniref:Casein kinase substrate phosphoprotein PP28 domain-containing protein n=1 Tax=Sarocladium strictum TaxID=5046 RepID=A0AA39GBZ6_SARSR|nr:hypothetical protein NLU13_8423 [Sarocladium strictum]